MTLNKKTLEVTFSTLIVVVFVFLVSTQIFGIPLWWVFRGMVPLSIIQFESKFDVTINPEAPMNIGDKVTVTVRNASNNAPVANAKVSVKKDGTYIFDYYTDSNGQTDIEYVGEVTVIEVSKQGFKTLMEAIPHAPDKWVREQNYSIASGVIGGISGSVMTYLLPQKRKKRGRK